jgi:hypothetical protein
MKLRLKPLHYLIIAFVTISLVKLVISLFRSTPWITWDELAYIDGAEQIFHGHPILMTNTDYTHAYPSGYSYFIAPAFALGNIGAVYSGMLAINAFLSTAVIFPAFFISRRFIDAKTSVLLSAVIAVLPAITLHTFAAMSENAFVPVFLLSAWLVMKSFSGEWMGHKKIVGDVAAGVSILLLVFIKATGVAMVAALFSIVLFQIIRTRSLTVLWNKILVLLPFMAAIPAGAYMLWSNGTAIGYNVSSYLSRLWKPFTGVDAFVAFGRVLLSEIDYYMFASYFFFTVFSLFFVWKLKKDSNKNRDTAIVFAVYAFATAFFLALVTTVHIYGSVLTVYSRYVYPVVPVFFIMGAIGIKKYLKHPTPKAMKAIAVVFFSAVGLFWATFPLKGIKLVNNLDIYNIYMARPDVFITRITFPFFVMTALLMAVLFVAFLYFHPKLKTVLVAALLASVALTAPALSLQSPVEIKEKEDNQIVAWLYENGADSVVMDSSYQGQREAATLEKQLVFWWRGDIVHTDVNNTGDIGYFLSPDNYSYSIVAEEKIIWNTWYLYDLQ